MIISRADQRNTAYICFSERIGQYKLYKGRWKIAISIFGRAVKVCLITPVNVENVLFQSIQE